jgi:hypothetical protein
MMPLWQREAEKQERKRKDAEFRYTNIIVINVEQLLRYVIYPAFFNRKSAHQM